MSDLRRRSIVTASALVVALCAFARSDERPAPPLQKVRISDDGRRFVLGALGETFVPWGFNYLGEFGKLVEESWASDWERVERDFREMRTLGANVVRIHLQFGTYMKGPEEFDEAELGRLRKMLDLASETGLYLDLTGLSCYRREKVPAWYDALDEAERWNVQARWWETIAETCAGHPAVFCYDLMNEPVINEPKEREHAWLGGEPLGGFYFVQRISKAPVGRTNVEIAEAWAKQLTTAIRAKDPQTLITVGAIPWAQVWATAKPIFYSPEAGKHFDFVSVHFYPKGGEVEKTVAALAVYDIGKPLVVEEIFPLACSMEELDEFIEKSKDRADGWIGHYFGKTIEEHRRGKTVNDAISADFLKYWREKGKSIAGAKPWQ